ncbi:MAG: hypothetical protein K2Z81_13570 [Cyanobacteria bacterium]|nr:hypothetical protein [Cyanobacteriota bacterium]
MPGIDSISFDTSNCELRESNSSRMAWLSKAMVAHLLRFSPTRVSWPFDLTEPTAAKQFYTQQCADNGGAVLSLDVIDIQGTEALSGLFKYRAPVTGSLGMHYVGILWLPFENCNFQINIEAMESGATGMREAAVMLMEPDSFPKSNEPPVLVESADDLFNRMRSSKLRKLPSDDAKYDRTFPDHPLSKVRSRLTDVISSLKLEDRVKILAPFRV